MDRPSGAYILDEKTGAITPDLNDEAMRQRQPIADSSSLIADQSEKADEPEEQNQSKKSDKSKKKEVSDA